MRFVEFLNITEQNYQNFGPEEWLKYAYMEGLGNFPEGMEAENYQWQYNPQLPMKSLTDIADPEMWIKWFKQENAMAKEDGRSYDYLTREVIRDPIVLVSHGNKIEDESMIDGWHRTAASFVAGRKSIPAIIGTPNIEKGDIRMEQKIGEAARHDVSVSRLGLYLHDLIARYMDKMGEQDEYGGYYGFEWKRIKGGDTQFRQSFDIILNRMGVSDDSNFSIMGPVWFSPYKLRKGLLALKPYASDSGFGFTPDGQPAILIAIRSEQNLPINFRNERISFVHEFTHFLDYMRSTDKRRAGVNPRKEGFTAYYSDPKEFNAYFQEVAGEFVERVKGVKTKEQAQRILGHNFPEFLEKIMDLFPEMYREIPKYDRKAKTRFYKFYAELLDRYF